MIRRKHAIIRTNLYNQLDIAWWDTVNRVFAQMDTGLYCRGWDMVIGKANHAELAVISYEYSVDIK